MYMPNYFREEDAEKIKWLIDNYPLGLLVSVDDGAPVISHLPFLFEPQSDGRGKLITHLAKANPHWHLLQTAESVTAVFQAADGYVSPTWYADFGVPTWNYAVVHIQGRPKMIRESAQIAHILQTMSEKFEQDLNSPWLADFSRDPLGRLASGVVGMEVDIEHIDAKYKLSQNRSPEERSRIMTGLNRSRRSGDKALAALMKTYFD